jgi:hypothetical protein
VAYDPRVVAAFNKAAAHTDAPDAAKRALLESGLMDAVQQSPHPSYWKRTFEPYRAALEFLGHARPLAESGLSPSEIVAAVHRGEFPDSTQPEAKSDG